MGDSDANGGVPSSLVASNEEETQESISTQDASSSSSSSSSSAASSLNSSPPCCPVPSAAPSKKKHGPDYSEISPNKRYIRYDEMYSHTADIKASFRGFDTKNGIEVVWQKIYLSNLSEGEQEPIMRSLNYLKNIQQEHIVEYLSIWVSEESRTLNLITTYLDPLEVFVAKVKTLRWRIVKKWCKQLLTGLNYLHTSNPVIVHRNLNLGNIFMNGGLGEIYLGGMWLSAVLSEGAKSVNMSSLISNYCYQGRQPGSPSYKAPEVLSNEPLTTKTDIYSFGMCILLLLTREDPYVEVYNDYCLDESNGSSTEGSKESSNAEAREKGFAAIASLITKGVLPDALERVREANPEAAAFLHACLSLQPADRQSAEELLSHPFLLQTTDPSDDSVVIRPAGSKQEVEATKESSAESEGDKDRDAVRQDEDGIGVGLTTSSRASQQVDSAESSYVSELAKLGTSDDVKQDRGIHDGRRAKEALDQSEKRVATENKSKPQPHSELEGTGAPDSPTLHAVIVQLHIAGKYTSDGLSKEVEFVFDLRTDRVDVIAAEMKEELSLSMSVPHLSELIESSIRQRVPSQKGFSSRSGKGKSDKYSHVVLSNTMTVVSEQASSSHDCPATTSTTITPTGTTSNSISAASSGSGGVSDGATLHVSREEDHHCSDKDERPSPTASEAKQPAKEQQREKQSSPTGSRVVSLTLSSRAALPPSSSSASTSAVVSSPTRSSRSSSTSSRGEVEEEAVPSSDPLKRPLEESPEKVSASGFDASVPPPEEDATAEEVAGYEAYLKEVEAIEKESRAARRVFEQRIQKHKIIQEACEEDMQKMRADFEAQKEKICGKLLAAEKKKDEEVCRLKSELEASVQSLKEEMAKRRQRQRRRDERHQQLHPHPQQGAPCPPSEQYPQQTARSAADCISSGSLDQQLPSSSVSVSVPGTVSGGSVDGSPERLTNSGHSTFHSSESLYNSSSVSRGDISSNRIYSSHSLGSKQSHGAVEIPFSGSSSSSTCGSSFSDSSGGSGKGDHSLSSLANNGQLHNSTGNGIADSCSS